MRNPNKPLIFAVFFTLTTLAGHAAAQAGNLVVAQAGTPAAAGAGAAQINRALAEQPARSIRQRVEAQQETAMDQQPCLPGESDAESGSAAEGALPCPPTDAAREPADDFERVPLRSGAAE